MPDSSEKRSLVSPVEIRTDSPGRTVAGYAAVFGEVADIGGYFQEVIARGAFAETLKTADVRAYFDHDTGRVLGRLSAGTLRMEEDARGLAVEIDLPETSDGNDVMELVRRGDVTGMSFGFSVTKQEWDETGEIPVRTIKEVVLREVSIVSEPAYDGTSIALRSLAAVRNDRSQNNHSAALRRISERRAIAEAKFRGVA